MNYPTLVLVFMVLVALAITCLSVMFFRDMRLKIIRIGGIVLSLAAGIILVGTPVLLLAARYCPWGWN